jgi:ribosomal protein S13
MAVYNTERQQVENVCEQNITEKWKVQYVMFEELNTISNTIEKKYTYKENLREYGR